MKKSKVFTPEAAAQLIKDGDCIAISSAGLIGYPDFVAYHLEKRFEETGHPKDLSLYSGCGHGVPQFHAGDARFAHKGMVRKVICSHPKPVPDMCKLIDENDVLAYMLPQGVLQQLYRVSAAKQPGLLTKIGIGTYIDPRLEGGRANSITTEDIVRVTEIDGEEWLFYKAFPVTAAIIRGTTADENGNLTVEREALKLEILEIAMAAHAGGGKVIAQVESVAAAGTLKAKDIVVPGELVDAVVVTEDIAEYHRQTCDTVYSPFLSGELRAPAVKQGEVEAKPLAANDVVCRRAAFELFPDAVVNVGVGIGSGVGDVAKNEGIETKVTFTLELGAFGGSPRSGGDFGATLNPTAFVAHPSMFDFYHSGGLDITFLGAAQIDQAGNVNASMFNGHSTGQGGFIDISQSARKVVFCTYFAAAGLKASVVDGKLSINQEGRIPKFVKQVDQITFSAKTAVEQGKPVVYVTERGVFQLTPEGVMLMEIAPGVDLEKDIIANMGFRPLISDDLHLMDERIFSPGVMNLKETLFGE